jgi:acyl-CoA dehydrogenase
VRSLVPAALPRRHSPLSLFLQEECIPAERVFHLQVSTDPAKRWKQYPAVMETLKAKARKLGLWCLFLSKEHYPDVGVPLTNLEYAIMAEIMGRASLLSLNIRGSLIDTL